jgi:Leucine-rich repeat (LRR) protein
MILMMNLARRIFGESCIEENEGTLTLRNCTIDALSFDGISMDLPDVKEIQANYLDNNFPKLDDETFVNFTNLEKLDLGNCIIYEISDKAFQGLTKLKELYLGANELKELDKNVFHPLTNLEVLQLYDNPINYFDENLLKHNQNLKRLALSSNNIISLDPKFMSNLKNLETLWIGYNKITTLDAKTFAGNRNLKDLYLGNNNITAIERDTFQNLSQLRYMNLNGNNCTNDTFAFDNITKLNQYLEACYKNFEESFMNIGEMETTSESTLESTSPEISNKENSNVRQHNSFANYDVNEWNKTMEAFFKHFYKSYMTSEKSVVETTPESTSTKKFDDKRSGVLQTDSTKNDDNVNNNDDSKKLNLIIIGSTVLLLVLIISLLINLIMCVSKSKNNTVQAPEPLDLNETVYKPTIVEPSRNEPTYLEMNALKFGAKRSMGQEVEIDKYTNHIYNKIPKNF